MKFKVQVLLVCLGMMLGACAEKDSNKAASKPDFEPIKGIEFHEVKRRFSNGLSFDTTGFQLEPSWIINFKSNDSISAWSPDLNRWHTFDIQHDHDEVFSFIYEYFRVKKLTKDSVVLQRLEVRSMKVMDGFLSDVNLTFYSKNYIEKVLKTTPDDLRRPTARDTAFIRELKATPKPKQPTKPTPFAARMPVQFISKSKVARVRVTNTLDKVAGRKPSSLYMYPEYRIEIDKAYKDFKYEFSAVVDANGNIEMLDVTGKAMYPEVARKVVQGIADVYIRNLFIIVPGTTLSIPHSSEITIYVIGKQRK